MRPAGGAASCLELLAVPGIVPTVSAVVSDGHVESSCYLLNPRTIQCDLFHRPRFRAGQVRVAGVPRTAEMAALPGTAEASNAGRPAERNFSLVLLFYTCLILSTTLAAAWDHVPPCPVPSTGPHTGTTPRPPNTTTPHSALEKVSAQRPLAVCPVPSGS